MARTASTAAESKSNNSTPAEDAKAKVTSKIHKAVTDNGGITKINLGQLRDELGFQRIGRKILAKMSDYLEESNLGYFPGGTLDENFNPEPRQWQEVWVYERDGSPRSAILDAVADPDNYDLAAAFSLFSSETPDYSKMSEKDRMALIRAVVCK